MKLCKIFSSKTNDGIGWMVSRLIWIISNLPDKTSRNNPTSPRKFLEDLNELDAFDLVHFFLEGRNLFLLFRQLVAIIETAIGF